MVSCHYNTIGIRKLYSRPTMQIFQSDNLCHLLSINFAGDTYASEVGMEEPDLTHIPEKIDITGKPFVYFDLETTGFVN